MKELIYKFLDDYLGDEIYCKLDRGWGGSDLIYSSKNDCVLFNVSYYRNKCGVFEGPELILLISRFFCIEYVESKALFGNWFYDKYNFPFKKKEIEEFLDGIREPPRPNSLRSVESPAPF